MTYIVAAADQVPAPTPIPVGAALVTCPVCFAAVAADAADDHIRYHWHVAWGDAIELPPFPHPPATV